MIGVMLLMFLLGCVRGLVDKRPSTVAVAPVWNLASLSGFCTAILAPLARFSVVAPAFLPHLARAAQTSSFADVMAMFLIASSC